MCIKWLEKKVKKFKWYDISLTKLAVFFFTLFLVAVWPAFRELALSIAWYWYLALGIIFAIPVIKRMFT